ncbi:ABC transporter permease [Desulfosporosinus youngiae]|uniref:Permease component of ribose/xylose/arabinose/galactoside ABC-type transporter n=1 Tax=Desulfosporosinus youngiae DSM 17734 TaxID=768710 RepID=H5Y0F5_9FIRM|nr:ABC transporter permease [Desulfosporosinus youngiae]EHQ92211.1 permease component of ribose/xylose/arabinose/galactoside ABC-type transporter [Desulfosporosinus youngiae DSM 17734]
MTSNTASIKGRTGTGAKLIIDNMLIIILIFELMIGAVLSPVFLGKTNIEGILINITIYGLLAIGQSLVMLVKEIDLSLGALMAFAPIAAIALTKKILAVSGSDVIVGGNYVVDGLHLIVLFVLVISALIGVLNGIISVKAQVPSLIVTLGMLYVLSGLSYILSGGYSLYLTNLEGAKWLGSSKLASLPVNFLLFLVVGVLVIFVLKYTKVGHRIYSTGGNEKAATYSGINAKFWKVTAFGLSGLCAGISALVYSSRLESVETTQGSGYELIAIAIAVIGGITLEGGKGKIFNTIIASAILCIMLNILSLIGLVAWYKTIVIGLIIIGAASQRVFSRK